MVGMTTLGKPFFKWDILFASCYKI